MRVGTSLIRFTFYNPVSPIRCQRASGFDAVVIICRFRIVSLKTCERRCWTVGLDSKLVKSWWTILIFFNFCPFYWSLTTIVQHHMNYQSQIYQHHGFHFQRFPRANSNCLVQVQVLPLLIFFQHLRYIRNKVPYCFMFVSAYLS